MKLEFFDSAQPERVAATIETIDEKSPQPIGEPSRVVVFADTYDRKVKRHNSRIVPAQGYRGIPTGLRLTWAKATAPFLFTPNWLIEQGVFATAFAIVDDELTIMLTSTRHDSIYLQVGSPIGVFYFGPVFEVRESKAPTTKGK